MLKVENISKTYKDLYALKNVSLEFSEGVYALLGPNGSGKSTLMNIISGLLVANEGDILFEKNSIKDIGQSYYDNIGYAPQQQGLYEEMSGERFLTYMCLLKKINKKKIDEEVQRVSQLVNMQKHLDKKCREYSGGMKQRILVAQALIGNPKILLFDEPTAGLDPKERVSLRMVFASLSKEHIIVIATHVVSDIETIAKEIIFLREGEIVSKKEIEKIEKTNITLEDVYLSLFKEGQDDD